MIDRTDIRPNLEMSTLVEAELDPNTDETSGIAANHIEITLLNQPNLNHNHDCAT